MKTFATSLLAFVLSLSGLIAFPQNASAEKTFQWKFVQGKTWQISMTQSSLYTAQGKTTDSTQAIDLTWTVRSVNEQGEAIVEQQIQKIVVKSGDATLFDSSSQDSTNEPNASIAKKIRPLVGMTMQSRMNSKGRVLDVTLSPEVIRMLDKNLSLSSEQIREIASQGILEFPSSAVDVGESWVIENAPSSSAENKVQSKTTYQYVGTEKTKGNDLERFKVIPSFQIKDSDQSLAKQDASGTIWFDTKIGRVVQSEFTQEFSLKPANDPNATEHSNLIRISVQFRDTN